MSEKSKKYVLVDHRILTENSKVDFSLYETNETRTQMSLFLQSDSVISSTDKIRIREVENLYISEDDSTNYRSFVDKHLSTIAANPYVSIEEKAELLYEKASEIINDIFQDPENMANAKACENIVQDFIYIVKDDKMTVSSLMKIAAHDYYTHTHSINVSIYSIALGQFMGLQPENLKKLAISSILHDLGKSTIDHNIINKNGTLTEEEFKLMKNHPAAGYNIAISMGIKDVDILRGIRHHHEKMDGKGYPDSLKKTEISLFARIIGLCDIFDALSTRRSYKNALSTFESLNLMKKEMSTHIDMTLLKKFIEMMKADYCKV